MTLQEQINAAASGATITLPDNSEHVGNFVVDKSLTIQGKAIIRSPNVEPALRVVPKTGPVSLLGKSINEVLGITHTTNIYDIVRWGEWQTSSLADVPQGLTLEFVDVFGAAGKESQRGFAANGANLLIKNSKIRDIKGKGYDTQAVCAWNGPGPFKLIDSYFEASGENVLFGGADARIPNLIPTGIEIRRCHFSKPKSWNYWDQANFKSPFGEAIRWTTDPMPGPGEEPNDRYAPRYVGPEGNKAKHWTVKNLFELKNARNVVIDDCLFENCWGDAQIGYAILITVRNQDGANPWAVIENVQLTNCIVRDSERGIETLGTDYLHPSQQCSKLTIQNMLFQRIAATWLVLHSYNDVTIEHVTHQQGGNMITFTGNPSLNFIYRYNATQKVGGYGFKGDSLEEGNPTFAKFAPNGVIQSNVIAGVSERFYPAGNAYPADLSGLPSMTGTDGKVPGYLGKPATPTPTPEPTPIPTPQPPTPSPSPDGTKAVTITDATNGVWTIGAQQQTLRNGTHMGNGFGSIYKWLGGVTYVLGTNAWWYRWTGTSWQSISSQLEPGTEPVTRTAAWPKQAGQQNALLDQQWTASRYRLKRIDGNTATFERAV